MARLTVVLLLLVALLVACKPKMDLPPAPTVTPRATNTSLPVTATPTVTPHATNTPVITCIVTAAGLNVRAGPGVEYPVISYLVSGAVVPVYSRATNQDNGEWLLIAHVNPGWINARYCKSPPHR